MLYTHAGPEIGVASTKAFTTQLDGALPARRSTSGGGAASIDADAGAELLERPGGAAGAREGGARPRAARSSSVAKKYGHAQDFLFLGRGIDYPIALEGALKLKEISYIHAEGYAGGRDEARPDRAHRRGDAGRRPDARTTRCYEKTLSNLQEVEARGGRIIVVTDATTADLEDVAWEVLEVPATQRAAHADPADAAAPAPRVPRRRVPRHDVDQPRNLAKSVTVE